MNVTSMVKGIDSIERIPAGTAIFRQGDLGDYMYVIMEGEVDVLVDGKFVRTLKEGEIFGEMALIDDQPRSADAIARSDCSLTMVDERRFLFLVHETPMFALHLMSMMAQRLRRQEA